MKFSEKESCEIHDVCSTTFQNERHQRTRDAPELIGRSSAKIVPIIVARLINLNLRRINYLLETAVTSEDVRNTMFRCVIYRS